MTEAQKAEGATDNECRHPVHIDPLGTAFSRMKQSNERMRVALEAVLDGFVAEGDSDSPLAVQVTDALRADE